MKGRTNAERRLEKNEMRYGAMLASCVGRSGDATQVSEMEKQARNNRERPLVANGRRNPEQMLENRNLFRVS